jgi:hypothetical protein
MSRRTWVGVFLALQHAATEDQAEALIQSLASPETRALARREWREHYARTVKHIGEAS